MFLPILAVTALASGCTKEYLTVVNGVDVYTHEYTITPSQWTRNEGNNLPGAYNYLYASFENADITPAVMSNGTVQAYVYNVYDSQNNLGAWNTLPFVYPLEVYVPLEEGGTELIIVPENLRFEWEEGKVTFIIHDLDGYDPEDMISTIHIKVCVTK